MPTDTVVAGVDIPVCRQEVTGILPPPLAYSDNHVVYRQMDVKRTLCQPSERLSSFVVSDEDGQLIQWATPLPSSVTRLTKKYRNKPYKAIETNWSWSPSKTWMQTIKKLDIKHCRTR